MNDETKNKTNAVENWWNNNPFTCGVVSTEGNDLTGLPTEITENFFKETERKMRKWWVGATHEEGEPLLSKFVPYKSLQGAEVLDIAVGTGWSSIEMAQHGAHVTGIDLTENAIKISKQHADLKKVSGINFLKMDAQNLEFPNEKFDFALAWGCHMHMPDTQKSLHEVYRVLKPRGMTVSYWYNKSSWTYWFNFMFLRGILGGKLFTYKGDSTRLVSRFTDGSSKGGNELTKVYSPDELEKLYRDAGFSSVWVKTVPMRTEVEGWPVAKVPLFKYLPASWRRYLGKQWAWGLVAIAIK